MEHKDLLIVGAGAAGLAAARSAASQGCSVVLADRAPVMGGVLPQCAHHGFAAGLTGPEYLRRLTEDFPVSVDYRPNTTVLSVTKEKTALKGRTYQCTPHLHPYTTG